MAVAGLKPLVLAFMTVQVLPPEPISQVVNKSKSVVVSAADAEASELVVDIAVDSAVPSADSAALSAALEALSVALEALKVASRAEDKDSAAVDTEDSKVDTMVAFAALVEAMDSTDSEEPVELLRAALALP